MDTLPVEMIREIASHLSLRNKLQFRASCRTMYKSTLTLINLWVPASVYEEFRVFYSAFNAKVYGLIATPTELANMDYSGIRGLRITGEIKSEIYTPGLEYISITGRPDMVAYLTRNHCYIEISGKPLLYQLAEMAVGISGSHSLNIIDIYIQIAKMRQETLRYLATHSQMHLKVHKYIIVHMRPHVTREDVSITIGDRTLLQVAINRQDMLLIGLIASMMHASELTVKIGDFKGAKFD